MRVYRCDWCESELPENGLRCYSTGPSVVITPITKSHKYGDKDQHFCDLTCLSMSHGWLVLKSDKPIKEATNENPR